MRCYVEISQVFILKMKFEGFFKIGNKFVERFSLCYNGKVNALSYVIFFPFVDVYLYDLFHA